MENGSFFSSSQDMGLPVSQYSTAKKATYVSTGSHSLDRLLSGGIRSNAIYEISGLLNSGKLQLILNLVKNYLKMDKKVLWIDTSAKIPLNDLIKLDGFQSDLLVKDNLHHIRIEYLVQLVVLLKQLNNSSETYSLIVINEFSDLVHSSFLVLEEELNKRKRNIELIRRKIENERLARQSVGETYHPTQTWPSLGPSVVVRQNKLMHQILGALATYNTQNVASSLLVGSLNITSQKFLLEKSSGNEAVRKMKTLYQSRLVSILGEDVPWMGLLESRIILYKDWKDKFGKKKVQNIDELTTVTSAVLKFNRPVISNDSNYPSRKVIKTTKKVRFKITSNGVEDIGDTAHDSVIGFAGTQGIDAVEFDDMSILMASSSPILGDKTSESSDISVNSELISGKSDEPLNKRQRINTAVQVTDGNTHLGEQSGLLDDHTILPS